MTDIDRQDTGRRRLLNTKPKAVKLSSGDLVDIGLLYADQTHPILIQPISADVELVDWAKSNQAILETYLEKHGAILLQGFDITSVDAFHAFATAISDSLLADNERSTQRSEVGSKIFTASEYPADLDLPLHNEMSMRQNWPMKIWFYCELAPQEGGQTPIADSRQVYQRIDPAVRDLFIQKQVMYVRNYGDGLDLAWQEVFQTTDRSVVEAYCHKAAIGFEWKDQNRLRTHQVRPSVAQHPKTADWVWFNQAHAYHISNIEPETRALLLETFEERDLPMNTYFGDGTPIEESILDHIRSVYQELTIAFPWKKTDILMLDNMLMAHGRKAFKGPRKILAAMADLRWQ